MYRFFTPDSTANPTREDNIQALEHTLHFRFPDALRQFYLHENGRQIYPCEFSYGDRDFDVVCLMPLFNMSVSATRSKEILAHIQQIPASYFPFAQDSAGDNYFVDLDSGKVFYISLDHLDRHKPAASSVDEFFALMDEGVKIPAVKEQSAPEPQISDWSGQDELPVLKKKKTLFSILSRTKKQD